jgi:MOSC domain-containing protein YiiM
MAKILHIFRAPKKRLPMEEIEEARMITNVGPEGCAHARPGGGPRQVLLVDRETLEAMDLRPGIVVNSLVHNQLLRIGEVRLEVSEICHPCDQLERIRPGLRREMRGRRGMLCRVLEGGMIRRGDAIEKVAPAATLPFAEDSRSGLAAK